MLEVLLAQLQLVVLVLRFAMLRVVRSELGGLSHCWLLRLTGILGEWSLVAAAADLPQTAALKVRCSLKAVYCQLCCAYSRHCLSLTSAVSSFISTSLGAPFPLTVSDIIVFCTRLQSTMFDSRRASRAERQNRVNGGQASCLEGTRTRRIHTRTAPGLGAEGHSRESPLPLCNLMPSVSLPPQIYEMFFLCTQDPLKAKAQVLKVVVLWHLLEMKLICRDTESKTTRSNSYTAAMGTARMEM